MVEMYAGGQLSIIMWIPSFMCLQGPLFFLSAMVAQLELRAGGCGWHSEWYDAWAMAERQWSSRRSVERSGTVSPPII